MKAAVRTSRHTYVTSHARHVPVLITKKAATRTSHDPFPNYTGIEHKTSVMRWS